MQSSRIGWAFCLAGPADPLALKSSPPTDFNRLAICIYLDTMDIAMKSPNQHQPDTEAVIAGALHGDSAALDQLVGKACERLHEIARVVAYGLGSPNGGVNGESDLAQSVAGDILKNPGGRLSEVYTSEDLQGRLHKLLYEKWIHRCRAAKTQKRGGGKVAQATQVGGEDDESPLVTATRGYGQFTPATLPEVAADVNAILDTFKPGSQRRQILELLFHGYTQEEIGQATGLSRDAVGRCIRSMGRSLQQLFGDEERTPQEPRK